MVDKRSIAAARNGGASLATGSVLCFVDADLVIHPQSFNTIDSAMADGQLCGRVTGWKLERYSAGLRTTVALMRCLTRLAGVNAGMIFCQADIFEEIGGYNEDKKYAEDVEFFRAMRKLGKKKQLRTLLSTGTSDIASTRKFDKHGSIRDLINDFQATTAHGKLRHSQFSA